MTQKERIQSMGKDLGLVSDLKDDADEETIGFITEPMTLAQIDEWVKDHR